ncbi:hypothetical protein ABPG72_002378, partial [Tetrahymena utriculariae]
IKAKDSINIQSDIEKINILWENSMSALKEQNNTQQQIINIKSTNLVEVKQRNQTQNIDSCQENDQAQEKKVEINNNNTNLMNHDDIQVNKEDDEDKFILMELIAKKNSQLIDQPQAADLSIMKDSKVSQARVFSRQIENNSISSQQIQNNVNANFQGFVDNQPVLPSLSQLERRRYISTEIEQQSSNISSNNYMDALAAQYTNTKSRYTARAAALGQGSVQSNNQTSNQEQSEKQQLQTGLQGLNQQIQFKNPPPRSQVQYQSGLSSSQSLAVQRDFHIYYQIGSSNNNADSSKPYEDDILMMNQEANETVKVPIDEIQEDTTVQDAIQSAVCQINNQFSISKANYRLEYDDSLYDMYLAKKNGEKKSLPALYPLEKMKKFSNSNMVLIPKDGSALKRLVLNGSPKKFKNNMSDQKANNRETIKEESFVSNNQSPSNSYIFNQANRNGSQSQNKTSSSFTGNPPQNNNPNTRKSMQSTITQKQTKMGNQEREGGDSEIISSPSKCFPFFCCMRGNASSSNKQSSSQSNSSKKRSKIATS